MAEPTQSDIVDKILDKLEEYLEADLKTNIAASDAARVSTVVIGPLVDDPEQYVPYIEIYHDEEHTDKAWHKGGSYPVLLSVGGSSLWHHHFRVEVHDYRTGSFQDRTVVRDRHAALRYRVKKCLMDHPNLDSVTDSMESIVAGNCRNDLIVWYTTEEHGGEGEWIWKSTYYVRYRVDTP